MIFCIFISSRINFCLNQTSKQGRRRRSKKEKEEEEEEKKKKEKKRQHGTQEYQWHKKLHTNTLIHGQHRARAKGLEKKREEKKSETRMTANVLKQDPST